MDLTAQSIIRNDAERTATSCYMKGFRENLRIQTSSGLPWFHRRICFTLKGPNPFNVYSPGDFSDTSEPINKNRAFMETSQGFQRLWLNQENNNATNTRNDQWELLFKGIVQVDWNDLIVAPVDTTRVSLKFDKTWTIQSGNQYGIVKERKLWHGMHKGLTYGDEETGNSKSSDHFSTTSKIGMGDYYVVDIIQPGTGGGGADLIEIQSNSTMYWHEK